MKPAHRKVPTIVSAIATYVYKSDVVLYPVVPGLMMAAIYPGAMAVAKLT